MELAPQIKFKPLTEQYTWREIAELFSNRIIERQFLGDFNKKKFIDWFMQREKVGLCFDWRMVARCYTIWQSLQKQNDHFTVICGKEGEGKSTLGNQICAWVSPNFSNDDIAFTMKQYLAKLNSISDDYAKDKTERNDRSVNIDEGGIDLFSREAMKSNNIILAKTFMVQRFLNVNVVICIPYYLGIDKIIRDHRIKTLIIIKARGQYKCIVGRGIKAFNGGLKMNKDTPLNNVPIPYGYFWEGTFRKGFPDTLDRKAYDDYKYKHIKDFLNSAGKDKEEVKEQTPKEFNPMEDLPSYRKLTDLARKMGINSKALIKQVKMGELPAIKTGKNGKGNWLVTMDTFKDMLNRGNQQT